MLFLLSVVFGIFYYFILAWVFLTEWKLILSLILALFLIAIGNALAKCSSQRESKDQASRDQDAP